MSLFITSLNSGSNGNCYYVGNAQEAVLVDVGISCRETEKRLQRLGLDIKKVKAIFISHEHSDHIKGVEVLSRKHRLPVYITLPTLRSGGLRLESELVTEFKPHQEITVGGLCIKAFPKFHDASDPHSFIISENGITIGVFTDIGSLCGNVIENFKRCHAAFLETNYDETMLEEGNYPFYLKKRIRGTHGHLSNHQALELFVNHRASFLSHILLSHLSKENNSPQLAQKLFEQHAGTTKVVVASRYYETPVFKITENAVEEEAGVMVRPNMTQQAARVNIQTSLF